ncbi:hypothetical protein [Alteromonas oceanisediminis]|uniref:hypothetical protein n=1 Tax=Alteromonas oceanisediminis TaxID=2836180 RepID=UPI001BDA554E|nr:hypothetical protein [Alteromonas oceanisediminis]MBT0585586.1 hypothetical protein [Alteromonas oceanisediminis]
MNEVVSQLQSLVTGTLSNQNNVLNTCRLEVFGQSIWGHRAIVEYFRRHPLTDAFASPHIVSSGDMVAMLGVSQQGETMGVFCETVNNNILRLWVTGPKRGAPKKKNQYVSVAFDPMLSQVPSAVAMNPSEHASLDASAAQHIRTLAESFSTMKTQTAECHDSRRKVFVLRAFSNEDQAAALLAIHDLQLGKSRQSSFHYLITTFRFDDEQILHRSYSEDLSTANEWIPRIAEPEPAEEVDESSIEAKFA